MAKKKLRWNKLLKTSRLEKFELWKCVEGFPYEVRMSNIDEVVIGAMTLRVCEKSMTELEVQLFPALTKLLAYELGEIKLRKKKLKELVFQAYEDNFDRIAKLKEYKLLP